MNIHTEVFGVELTFKTSEKLFSYKGADKGTLFMLNKCNINKDDIILDLGCGYGLVGISCAKIAKEENIIMCDNDPLAVQYAKINSQLNNVSNVTVIQSDAYESIDRDDFTLILSNPPYHADFSVPKRFIEQGYKKLIPEGRMLMVTKRLEWYKKKFISVFGGVKIFRMDDYFVFLGIKSSDLKIKKNKNINIQQEIS
ncbi:MAG TPA: methyltransferase [Clostridia bacterium]|nr:MAG: Ribosomal RNA large subunit methyltransferase G [Firmicutes bacterium ADurb.Bin146]HOD93741.1 methyltransferase [Clostridia bacterium]HQM39927.1 methyltransferase [Clostridia bacterium]